MSDEDSSGVSPDQLTRRPRRSSKRGQNLDQQALDHRRRRSSLRIKKVRDGISSPASPRSPTSPRDFVLREDDEAKCGLEELVLTGAVGRKAEEARAKRAKAERWRKAMKPDEDDESHLLHSISKELEALLAGIAKNKQLDALKQLAFSQTNCSDRALSFDQLVDALESVDNGWKRTIVLLCLAPHCLVRQHEFLPGNSMIPALPKAARCLATVVLEMAQAFTRLKIIDNQADVCAAQAACAAAALEALIARTDTTDIDNLRSQLAQASDAKLESDLSASRAHDVAHTGLFAETLVSALAQMLNRQDFVDAIIDDDDFHKDITDRRNCLTEAARRCANDILIVTTQARNTLHRILWANRIAKSAYDYAKDTLALALDEKDTLDDQREWQSHGVRADLEARARNNHENFSTKLKAPPDQISFDVPASSKRLALTLAALLRYKKLHVHRPSHDAPRPSANSGLDDDDRQTLTEKAFRDTSLSVAGDRIRESVLQRRRGTIGGTGVGHKKLCIGTKQILQD